VFPAREKVKRKKVGKAGRVRNKTSNNNQYPARERSSKVRTSLRGGGGERKLTLLQEGNGILRPIWGGGDGN